MQTSTIVPPGLSVRRVTLPLRRSDFRLIAFDMDSTLIDIECIDEIADVAGKGTEVAAITEAAMRGEIADFSESLRRRLALLAGTPVAALQRVFEHRLRLTPGVTELVSEAKRAGWKVMVVSGGFTYFTDRLKERLGLDYSRANVLEIIDEKLTGHVLGAIVDAEGKRRFVEDTCAAIGCPTSAAVVVGDGANDLDMMRIAGLSVAYRAKPKVRAQADLCIDLGGLDRVMEVFEK
jgi:phosphoserine phosphatase